jgi:hypothetical protein
MVGHKEGTPMKGFIYEYADGYPWVRMGFCIFGLLRAASISFPILLDLFLLFTTVYLSGEVM